MQASPNQLPVWHGTTILTVRKGGKVVIGGDGQVSIGQTVIKSNAKKVRKLGKGDVIGGFAGATADAFTLFERLESKLEQYPGQLTRAAVELAKDWRTDRYLRRLEAMMIVAVRMKRALRSLKTRPFNRVIPPSPLRDGPFAAELQPMVTGIRPRLA